jgi:hypothetical protein
VSNLAEKLFINLVFIPGLMSLLFSCAYFGKDRKVETTKASTHIERYKALEEKYNELLSQSTPSLPITSNKTDPNNDYQKIMSKKVKRTLDGQSYDRSKVARELRSLNRLQLKIKKKRYGDAVLLAKELENSSVEQIRAQARFLLAEAIHAQGENVLAVQIYEEIAISMPFSIFSKKAIEKGLEVSKLINDPKIMNRFKKLKAPYEETQRSFN